MRVWKVVGLAGVIGAVAAGATLGVRHVRRTRREFVDADIDEIRAHLHARLAAADAAQPTTTGDRSVSITSTAATASRCASLSR